MFNNKALSDKLFSRDTSRPLDYRMVKAAKGDSAEIYIYDMIGSWGVTAQSFVKDLKALGSVKHIDLHISSDGGDVFDGRAIYNNLVKHPATITAHVDGLAASIASLIMLAGDEVHMAEGSFVMIHNAWGFAMGDSNDMRKTADLLESVNNSIIDTYISKTGQSRDDIVSWMNEETWLTAQEALDLGFVTSIDEPLKMAAKVRNPGIFNKLPSALAPSRIAAVEALERIRALTGSLKTA